MWRIERANDATARACGSPGDSLAQLASTLGLDVTERARWITDAQLDVGALDPNEPLREETEFSVPNVVFLAWFGEWGGAGKAYMSWRRNQERLRRQGFDVVLFDNDKYAHDKPELAKEDFYERLERFWRDKTLYALYMMGHGSKKSVGSLNTGHWWNRTRGPQWVVNYLREEASGGDGPRNFAIGDAAAYKLGALVIQACDSQNASARALVGAAGLFWGAAGVYIPRPIDLAKIILKRKA